MHTGLNRLASLPALMMVMATCAVTCFAEDVKPLSRQEILAILPRGIDMLDKTDVANYTRLVEEGESTYEVLGEELVRVDDWITASRIIGIFVDSRGDKTVPLQYLKRFLELPKNDPSWRVVQSRAKEVIQQFEANVTDTRSASATPGGEPDSSTPWSVVAGVAVAAIGILILLLRKRR